MFFDHLPQQNIICAHRGARSIAPENTLLSMKTARDCGAHCLETDVQMSKDGKLVIFHDNSLERTTDIGSNIFFTDRKIFNISQFTFEELNRLDAGTWFLENDPFGTVKSNTLTNTDIAIIKKQRIPLLEEILEYSKKYSFPVNIEIKDPGTPEVDIDIVDNVMKTLRKTQTTDLVLISSFQHEYLRRVRELDKDINMAFLVKKQHPENLIQYLKDLSVAAYHPKESLCSIDLITTLQNSGIRVNAWTINNMNKAKEFLKHGVGVITDWPQLLTQ